MLLAHKIELLPNNIQATYFSKACGVSRFAYNWALREWNDLRESGEKPSEILLRKKLNEIKKKEYPWMLEVTKTAPQQAIKNLGQAFQRFFDNVSGYPRFKKKGMHDSFRADNGPAIKGADAVCIEGKKIKIPRIGWIRMKETLRFNGQVKSVVISRKANRYYAAISVDTKNLPHKRKNQGSVGVDLGIKTLATLSNGQRYAGPKAHSALLKRLRKISRSFSNKKRWGKNFNKSKLKLSKLHARIANIRNDNLHKLTTELVLNYDKIGIEDLNVKGMASNRKLSRHIMDQSFYEFRRQLEYKSSWYGSDLIVTDRFYPSSKLCSNCGIKKEDLKLSDREWICECGATHDRDINAAINIERYMSTVSSTGFEACGEESAGSNSITV
jgi:putative transposase